MPEMSKAQVNSLGMMKARDPKMEVLWDPTRGAPAMLKGALAEPFVGAAGRVAAAAALDFLEEKRQLFRMREPKEELRVSRRTTDVRGNHCVALQQTYKGIAVDGGTVRVHFSPENAIYQITNKYAPAVELDVEPAITSDDAYEKALADAGGGERVAAVEPRLAVLPEGETPKLAWVLDVISKKSGLPMRYFVGAKDGSILRKFGTLRFVGTGCYSGSGALVSVLQGGTYRLIDATRDTGGANSGPTINTCDMDNAAYNAATPDANHVSQDADDNWNNNAPSPRHENQGPEVDIHRYMGQVVDFYKAHFNWNGIDDAGTDLFAGAHVQFPGAGGPNNAAYWGTTGCFYFGDGNGTQFDYLSALDVLAHEFTHGVTDHTSQLGYPDDEPGALNEAFSDIFAAFIDNGDTMIGEDCTTPAIPGDCLRRLDNPSSPNAVSQIPNHVVAALDTMGIGYKPTTYNQGQIVQGDPHVNCGPVIYAAALLLVSGTHPNSGITVQPIGYPVCEQIFWHIQSNGLLGNPNATFLECRQAALDAVDALYKTHPDYLGILDSVKNAFTAVGIGPDIYVRDSLNDMGTIPNADPLYCSPDIIVRQQHEPSPEVAFADLTNGSFSQDVELDPPNTPDHFAYVRLQNRGSVPGDVDVHLYWAAPNTFAMPNQWHPIGDALGVAVAPNGLSVPEIVWNGANLPPLGHFCLVAELDSPLDPAPDKTLITNGVLFSKFIAESNNFAWKNINVVDLLPFALADISVFVSGDDETASELQFDLTELPASAEVSLRVLARLCERAEPLGMSFREASSRYRTYDMKPDRVCRLRGLTFAHRDTSEVHVYVRIPEEKTRTYTLTVTQLVNGAITGRITRVLNLMSDDAYDFIGNTGSLEVHRRGCKWVKKMSQKHKRGFRTLESAHADGYDNCAFCLGDSQR